MNQFELKTLFKTFPRCEIVEPDTYVRSVAFGFISLNVGRLVTLSEVFKPPCLSVIRVYADSMNQGPDSQ